MVYVLYLPNQILAVYHSDAVWLLPHVFDLGNVFS